MLQATIHEDLGRILPSEEPDVMMQMSILPLPLIKAPHLGSIGKRRPAAEEHESPYMEM